MRHLFNKIKETKIIKFFTNKWSSTDDDKVGIFRRLIIHLRQIRARRETLEPLSSGVKLMIGIAIFKYSLLFILTCVGIVKRPMLSILPERYTIIAVLVFVLLCFVFRFLAEEREEGILHVCYFLFIFFYIFLVVLNDTLYHIDDCGYFKEVIMSNGWLEVKRLYWTDSQLSYITWWYADDFNINRALMTPDERAQLLACKTPESIIKTLLEIKEKHPEVVIKKPYPAWFVIACIIGLAIFFATAR